MLTKNKSFSLKLIIKRWLSDSLFLEYISNGFGSIDSSEGYLKGNLYDFPVDYNATYKSEISEIHKNLIIKSNTR